jgi:hypothetical protein
VDDLNWRSAHVAAVSTAPKFSANHALSCSMNNTTTESVEWKQRVLSPPRLWPWSTTSCRSSSGSPPTGSMRPNDRWEWGSQTLLILDTEAEGEEEVEVEG